MFNLFLVKDLFHSVSEFPFTSRHFNQKSVHAKRPQKSNIDARELISFPLGDNHILLMFTDYNDIAFSDDNEQIDFFKLP